MESAWMRSRRGRVTECVDPGGQAAQPRPHACQMSLQQSHGPQLGRLDCSTSHPFHSVCIHSVFTSPDRLTQNTS